MFVLLIFVFVCLMSPKVAMVHDLRCKVCKGYYIAFFLFRLSWMLEQHVSSTKSCAYFSFENSSIHNNTVEVTENTTINVTFYLKNKTCRNMENIIIGIQKQDISQEMYIPVCNIVLHNGTCRDVRDEHLYCGCQNIVGAYIFSKTFSKSDITRWYWVESGGLAEGVYIWFNETLTRELRSRWHTVIFPVTRDVRSREHVVTFPVTRDVRSRGLTAFEGTGMFVTVALLAGLIIIVISLVIISHVKKTGQAEMKRSLSFGTEIIRLIEIYNQTGEETAVQNDVLPPGSYFLHLDHGNIIRCDAT